MSEPNEQTNNAIAAAERLITQLEQKHAAHVAHVTKLQAERNQLAFKVHADADPKARKRLDEINRELTGAASDVETLQVARQQAGDRLVEAQRAAALVADRAAALELRKAVAEFVELGVELDAALTDVAEAGIALRELLSKIHQLGCQFPTHLQIKALGESAVLTKLMGSPWPVRHLAPRERRDFTSLVKGWADAIERTNIAPRLGDGVAIDDQAA